MVATVLAVAKVVKVVKVVAVAKMVAAVTVMAEALVAMVTIALCSEALIKVYNSFLTAI